jgi:formate--tetrahydrofolate ligase
MNAPQRIKTIANSLGLEPGDVEPVGWFKGKLALGLEQRLSNRPTGKYINVTAVSPTPLGKGKTVVSIGLAMALCRLGHSAIATIREPSLAPVFGIKGGGAGGGNATLLPAEEINLHFTGDLHAVSSANNLLAAMIDNHIKRDKSPRLDSSTVTWRRAVDISDRGLEQIVTELGNVPQAPLRETGFDLTAASEVMAIIALATGLEDLRKRLSRIFVGRTVDGDPVFAKDIQASGAMAALLRDAIRPNLVQTCEHTPALVHAGPFGNIAHGNCSVLADLAAIRLADYVVTESGFGSDFGAKKFFNIKCRVSELIPDVEVLVCTVKAMKFHSGRFTFVSAGLCLRRCSLKISNRFGPVPAI